MNRPGAPSVVQALAMCAGCRLPGRRPLTRLAWVMVTRRAGAPGRELSSPARAPGVLQVTLTRAGRESEMKRTFAGLSLIAAALFGVVAAVPAPAMADSTATLTLHCKTIPCTAGWGWYQGGTSGTLLSSGSMSAGGNATGTTVQPATADTVVMDISVPAGREPCGASQTFSYSPGSHIDFTLILKEAATAYHRACFDTFNMKS